jgi:uroporphyrinogen decarboxylase
MTPRERLLTVLSGKIPDCVPVAPDFSNMIPARLTGKPFWDLYLYNDPPIWEAYIDCAKRFNIDSLMDGYFPLVFEEEKSLGEPWLQYIVKRTDERIITQYSRVEDGKRKWSIAVVYYRDNPPTSGLQPETLGLPPVPERFEPIEAKPVETNPQNILRRAQRLMGDQGLVGVVLASTCMFLSVEGVYDYYDHPGKYEKIGQENIGRVEQRFARIMALDPRPDFLAVGCSGSLVFQTPEMFRKLSLPSVKRAIELAHAAGIPTQVHSCGPERELVKILAEETDLTVIDPLEIPPMGDCNLAELKRLYGHKIVLKGNLHTTEVMLRGSVADVIAASKKAIDDAAAGGRFILSTGDQCGRDTPDANLHAMIETARTYGRY